MVYRQNTAPKINTALLHRAGEEPHFHQELEILYLMEGTLTVALDGKEYALQKDDVLVVNCSHTHALRGGGPGLTVLQVQVSYALLAEIAPGDVLYFHCNSAADAYHPYGEVRRLMRQLLLSYAGTRRCTEAVRYSYIYALLDLLIEHFRREPDADDAHPRQEEERLQAVIAYVNENFREPVNLGKLAGQMYLSTSSLSRLFKRSMGCYFADFVNQVRLSHAVRELAATDKTVTRIAADCGFPTWRLSTNSSRPPTTWPRQPGANSGSSKTPPPKNSTWPPCGRTSSAWPWTPRLPMPPAPAAWR